MPDGAKTSKAGHDPLGAGSAAPPFPSKTGTAFGVFVLLAAALPYAPGPVRLSGLTVRQLGRAFTLRLPGTEVHKTIAPLAIHPTKPDMGKPVPLPDMDIPAGSLDSFFGALRRTESKEPGAVTRIIHYGDSPTTADSITGDVRRLFQKRFGDAGHGFLLIAKPWAWYGHDGTRLNGKGWHIEPASQSRAADGFHGLGGVSFRGESGAVSYVRLPDDRHTRAIVYYLAQPGGGNFMVSAGDEIIAQVDTSRDLDAGEQKKPAFAEFALPAGTQNLELRVSSGKVRLFGYRFDKDQPGVQYSSLGVNGAQVQMMDRYFEVGQWTMALRHEKPDLVVLNYGTNESVFAAYIEKQYPEELRTAIMRIRRALPDASLLVMSPMDRGVVEGGDIVTPGALEKLIGVQKRIAAETGCAFYNTFEAMGGSGTMGRWYHSQPRLVSADFMHPLPQGAAKVGALFEGALVAAYESSGK